MSERLGPGSTFAGCRIEDVAGRGGMGVVFRATQLALERPVALKAIAPEFAADGEFRERFQRESHLAASIDHPNVIPVYEAGEFEGTLYLIMRWVEGTDLRTLLSTTGRLPPARAIGLLRPVAAALAAAHRRGLVHRDIKPANVLIIPGDEETEDHVYLTDFGIARRTGGDSLTRTGLFVGTVDYAAPERIEGKRGEAPSDIYSFGCMLFEAVTGRIPYNRPTDVSKMFAHLNDPIPSAREEVQALPEQLDGIISKAMAKRPEDRFGSAGELTATLGRVLQELGAPGPGATAPAGEADATKVRAPSRMTARAAETDPTDPMAPATAARVTGMSAPATDLSPPATAPSAPATELSAPATELSAPATELSPPATELSPPAGESPPPPTGPAPAMAGPTAPSRRPTIPVELGRPTARRRRGILWGGAVALVGAAGAAVALVFAGPGGHTGTAGGGSQAGGQIHAKVTIQGVGMTEGLTTRLSSPPSSISATARSVWVSLPDRGQVISLNPTTGSQQTLNTGGIPTAIAAGPSAVWIAGTAPQSLAEFNGDTGQQGPVAKLPGSPAAIALDSHDSSAWVADTSGAITHVGTDGSAIGTSASTNPPANSIGVGEGWVWATNGADNGLFRVSPGTDGASTAFSTHPGPIAVTFDQGVWTAHANGHVTRFDPRFNKLAVNADIATPASELDGIAATDPGPYVWAISKTAKALYRITPAAVPAVTGTVLFGSPPVSLAVYGNSVWVATEDGRITEIRY